MRRIVADAERRSFDLASHTKPTLLGHERLAYL
jgi:hypothetical protein